MVVCVLKHTPGVFVDYTNENDTIYSGLEVEVSLELKFNSQSSKSFSYIHIIH